MSELASPVVCQVEGVTCQFAQDVSMTEYSCVGKCQYEDRHIKSQAIPGDILVERDGLRWQPINTVPKDGTIVDLWHEEFGRQADMYWGKPEHCCGEYGQYCDSDWHSEPDDWVCSSINQSIFSDGYTHWMSLPRPPEGFESGANAAANSPAPEVSEASPTRKTITTEGENHG